jgi:hypothetical protein
MHSVICVYVLLISQSALPVSCYHFPSWSGSTASCAWSISVLTDLLQALLQLLQSHRLHQELRLCQRTLMAIAAARSSWCHTMQLYKSGAAS